jgi:YfiH family protein
MKTGQIEVVRVPDWAQFEWLRHGFSSRAGGLSTVYGPGELNLGFTKDDDAVAVAGNRAMFLRAVGGDGAREMVTVRQVHGTRMLQVAAGDSATLIRDGRAVEEADGMISAAPGVVLGVQAADCVPVLVADTKQRVVAAFHAGWRGTVAGVVERGIARMRSEFGSDPEDMIGAVGPSIGACCYSVGEEVREQFAAAFGYADKLFEQREGGLYLDLWQANRRQMVAAGLSAEAVAVVGECSACTRVDGRRKYFSHRAERGFTGRAMGMIGIAASPHIKR